MMTKALSKLGSGCFPWQDRRVGILGQDPFVGPVHDLEPAVLVLDQRGQALDPVAIVAVQRAINGAIARKDTAKILSVLFDRLYVLRNQLIHGGATWNSSVNRSQVKDGAAVLDVLLPIFIDLLMNNPNNDWGTPYYPVVD